MNIKNIAFLISCLSLNSTYNNNDVLCLNLNRMNAKTITQITSKPIVRKDKLLPELDTTTFDTRKNYDISAFRKIKNKSNTYFEEYKGCDNDIYLFKENYCRVFENVAHCIYGEPILDNIRVKNKKVSQYKGLGFIENKNFEIPDEVFVTFRLKNSINIPIATLQCASIELNNDSSLSLTFDVTNSVSFEYSNMEEMATKYGTTITASYGGNIGANVGIDKFVEVSGQKSFDVESSFSQEFTKTVAISKTLTFMVNSGLSYQFNPNNTYDS
ncbi:MAG: hypothetical protein HUJ61_00130, partial [Bacilli bacterium]|nr:hypothetical protein [Bacilli bacterium]